MPSAGILVGSVSGGETITVAVPLVNVHDAFRLRAIAELWNGRAGQISFSFDDTSAWQQAGKTPERLTISGRPKDGGRTLFIKLRASSGGATIRLSRFQLFSRDRSESLTLPLETLSVNEFPRPQLPPMRRGVQRALIQWDWRMQDGIGTQRQPRSFDQAIEETIQRGNALVRSLARTGILLDDLTQQWHAATHNWRRLRSANGISDLQWEELWRMVHELRRDILLHHPLANTGPIAFVKCVPTHNSIMQQQYLGRFARPGGGIFVLQDPGRSMRCRSLTKGRLPPGAYQHLDVSYDGDRVIFSFCRLARPPREARYGNPGHHFNIYEARTDGSGLTPLIRSDHDDFAPRHLPNGNIVFVSTRRGGYSRCGPDFSPCHTLALADATGSNQRLISFHEIHEFDPAVMNDGRIIYTRWDYVDREASLYQQLWVTRPDGSNPAIY